MSGSAQVSLPGLKQPFVIGAIDTPVGKVPQVSFSLSHADYLGSFKARWGIRRMRYSVDPGLYALGTPHAQSPVFVTANYKMSFDRLRKALMEREAWILVLDTKGINVWCAAGKGTFGTTELVRKVESSGLNRVVSHRELILPQLAGPGVAAHQVKKLSGFKVIYGPIRAEDLPSFLDDGKKAGPEMRIKTFPLWERLVLIPIELVSALKVGILILAALLLPAGLLGPAGLWENMERFGLPAANAMVIAIITGAVLTPLFLPWLPGRAFSLKGLFLGIAGVLWMLLLYPNPFLSPETFLEMMAFALWIPAAATYLAMNFTGASTYTSLSGVKKEMKYALPLQIVVSIMSLGLFIAAIILA